MAWLNEEGIVLLTVYLYTYWRNTSTLNIDSRRVKQGSDHIFTSRISRHMQSCEVWFSRQIFGDCIIRISGLLWLDTGWHMGQQFPHSIWKKRFNFRPRRKVLSYKKFGGRDVSKLKKSFHKIKTWELLSCGMAALSSKIKQLCVTLLKKNLQEILR